MLELLDFISVRLACIDFHTDHGSANDVYALTIPTNLVTTLGIYN